MTPDTKTKLTLIQTRNQAISEPHTKQSQFRSLHSKRVNSDPYTQNESIPIPHTEISSISTTHTTHKSISMSTLKPCHFRPVLFCVLHTWAHVPVIQQQYVHHINTSTNSYFEVLFLTLPYDRFLREYICIPYFIFCYERMVHTTYMNANDTGGRTSLLSIPRVRSTY